MFVCTNKVGGFSKNCTLCASTICTNKVGGFSKNCTLCASTICTNKVGGFSNFFYHCRTKVYSDNEMHQKIKHKITAIIQKKLIFLF